MISKIFRSTVSKRVARLSLSRNLSSEYDYKDPLNFASLLTDDELAVSKNQFHHSGEDMKIFSPFSSIHSISYDC